MKMKKTALQTAVLMAIGATASISAQAATTLNLDDGFYSCSTVQGDPGTIIGSACSYFGGVITTPATRNGSWFGMDASPPPGLGEAEKTLLSGYDGIILGTVQGATGSHTGDPFGSANGYTGTNLIQIGQDTTTSPATPIYIASTASASCLGNPANCTEPGDTTTDAASAFVATTTEVPGIDEPWAFFGNTGMHFTNSAVTDLTGAGATRNLDMSGWRVTWNGIPSINMGGGATGTLVCETDACADGDTYTLDYSAVVPVGDPSGFGGVSYQLHLEGTISIPATVVPVPAAVWLFGSGLLGLVGVARRKKSASIVV